MCKSAIEQVLHTTTGGWTVNQEICKRQGGNPLRTYSSYGAGILVRRDGDRGGPKMGDWIWQVQLHWVPPLKLCQKAPDFQQHWSDYRIEDPEM